METLYTRKKAIMEKKIKRWEHVYGNPRIVYLFVREELLTTISPSKQKVLTEWIEANPQAKEGFEAWLLTLDK